MQADSHIQSDPAAGVTLLLGIGAQKAGTSWLYAVLHAHPDCVCGPMKELHYFDSIHGKGQLGRRLRSQAIARLEARNGSASRIAALRRLQEICDAPDPDHASYLDLLTADVRPGQVATDITPMYATVSDEIFAQMAALPNVRMVFVMREPVARMWSAVRMRAGKVADTPDAFERDARDVLDAVLEAGAGGAVRRSDYARTIDLLNRHMPRDRCLVLFFEELFTQQAADRIFDFLGIARQPVTGIGVRNEGGRATMRPDQVERLTRLLRPQYEAMSHVFGSRLPQAWHARFAPGSVAA